MAKVIELTRNQSTIVDDEDFEKFNKFKWYCAKLLYACRDVKRNKQRTALLLHREIMNAPVDKHVDHINGNTLDNRKENLRLATKSTNGMNRGIPNNNTSGYKGVHFFKRNKNWQAYINFESKRVHLGYFDNKHDAARAYNEAAIKYHGEFAKLNEINLTEDV